MWRVPELRSFSWPSDIPCVTGPHFVYSFVHGYQGCFHFLAVNRAAVNVCVCVSFCMDVCFHFFWMDVYEWNCWVMW